MVVVFFCRKKGEIKTNYNKTPRQTKSSLPSSSYTKTFPWMKSFSIFCSSLSGSYTNSASTLYGLVFSWLQNTINKSQMATYAYQQKFHNQYLAVRSIFYRIDNLPPLWKLNSHLTASPYTFPSAASDDFSLHELNSRC